jgi:hypothetical protein
VLSACPFSKQVDRNDCKVHAYALFYYHFLYFFLFDSCSHSPGTRKLTATRQQLSDRKAKEEQPGTQAYRALRQRVAEKKASKQNLDASDGYSSYVVLFAYCKVRLLFDQSILFLFY